MEPLTDPYSDRVIKTHPAPPHKPVSHDLLFPPYLKSQGQEVPDWKYLKDHLLQEGRLFKADVIQLACGAMEIMKKEPNVL